MIGTNYCQDDQHLFEMIDSFTGGTTYRCNKCGLVVSDCGYFEYSEIKKYVGSRFGNTSYVWDATQSTSDITSFKISFGDYSIKSFQFENNKIEYKKLINGSRDGGNDFPKGYFDPVYFYPNEEQVKCIYKLLESISYNQWKTDLSIFKLMYCPGFCLRNIFVCTLKNGKKFKYMTSNPANGFKELANYLCSLFNFKKSYSDKSFVEITENSDGKTVFLYPEESENKPIFEYKNKNNDDILNEKTIDPFLEEPDNKTVAGYQNQINNKSFKEYEKSIEIINAVITSCCNVMVPLYAKYCPMCGKKIKHMTSEKARMEHDKYETIAICANCMAINSFRYIYCVGCGKKLL